MNETVDYCNRDIEMRGTGKANMGEVAKDPPPPAYTEDASAVPPQETQAPPDYGHQGSTEPSDQASTRMAATASPYRPFPSVMNAYYQWNLAGLKTFFVCGASRDERLYAVEVHTGYSGKGPLGMRPGLELHNGTSTKDPILAAAGDKSQFAAQYGAFSPDNVILLPALLSGTNPQQMDTETMSARTIGDDGVAFFFTVEVGDGEKMRREKFEWRKIKKGDEEEAKEGGFKLLRLSSTGQQTANQLSGGSGSSNSKEEDPSSSSSSSSHAADHGGGEVALFAWTKTWSNLDHPFTLQLLASLGERWTIMVVITALRLWELNVQGKTKRGFVARAEIFAGN